MALPSTYIDPGMEIGKAQAMAEAAQKAAERMEANLSDRIDRLEQHVSKSLIEIKTLVDKIHQDVTDLKIEDGRRDAREETKTEHKKDYFSVIALIVSLITGAAEAFGMYLQNKN